MQDYDIMSFSETDSIPKEPVKMMVLRRADARSLDIIFTQGDWCFRVTTAGAYPVDVTRGIRLIVEQEMAETEK